MQINFLKIQQKSRENGLVIFSKSILRFDEKTLLFPKVNIIRENWKDSILKNQNKLCDLTKKTTFVSEIQQNSSKIKFLDTNRTFAPVCRARVEKIPQGKKWQDGTLQNSQT